jgi:LETM1 and EF-hand domain-containing protein 1
MLRRYCYFDILTWRQVAALCSRLGLGTRAPKSWLIKRIRKHILHIMKDDQLIYEEGIDSLNEEELQEACWERGLKVLELDVSTLRIQLDEWLKLSLRWETLIEPLLIYAHAFEEKELFFQPGNDKMDSHL